MSKPSNQDIVRRRIGLASPATAAQLQALRDRLPDSVTVEAADRCLRLAYDRCQISFRVLRAHIEAAGMAPRVHGFTRLRVALWSYLDENARDNAAHPGSPCCSNPSDIYASRKQK